MLQQVSEKETSVIGNINTRKGVGPNSVLNLILKELISKILKKVMYSRLSKFLDKFDCLYKKQLGFRNAHSTNHALISITEEIRKALDNNEFS